MIMPADTYWNFPRAISLFGDLQNVGPKYHWGFWDMESFFFLILKTAKKNSYQAFFYKLPVLAHSDFMK